MFFKKDKYIVYFVRRNAESYRLLKKRRVLPDTKLVSYKKRVHLLDLSHESFSRKLKHYFLMDIENETETIVKLKDEKGKILKDKNGNEITETYYGGQLRYWGSNLKYNSGLLSFLTVEGGIRQLASGIAGKLFNTNTIVLLAMGIIMGLFAGLFFGWFF
ncbi:MAG: hypothetical protein ACFFDH_09510 [Promethearchaeota archaeon]